MRFRSSILIVCVILWPCVAVQRRAVGVQSRHGIFAQQGTTNPFGSLLTALGLGDAKEPFDATGPQHTPKYETVLSDSLIGDEAAMQELKATVRAAASAAGKDEEGEEWKGSTKEESDGTKVELDIANAAEAAEAAQTVEAAETLSEAEAQAEDAEAAEVAQTAEAGEPLSEAEAKVAVEDAEAAEVAQTAEAAEAPPDVEAEAENAEAVEVAQTAEAAKTLSEAELEAEDVEEEKTKQIQSEEVLAFAQGTRSAQGDFAPGKPKREARAKDEKAKITSAERNARAARFTSKNTQDSRSNANGFNSTPSIANEGMRFSAAMRPHRPHRPRRPRRPHRARRHRDDQEENVSGAPSDSASPPGPPSAPKRPGEAAHSNISSHAANGIIRKVRPGESQWPELSDEEVCDGPMQDCKRSMCRWLKMSSTETPGKCTLFETQLRSCSYSLPENRPQGAPRQQLDCAIELLRRTDVPMQEVGANVAELVACIENVPAVVNSTCYVALGLLRTEVSDWKEEVALKKSVSAMQDELNAASEQGRVALNIESKEDEAIAELTLVLAAAELIPGHYLVEDVREARGVLDRLAPIPAVRAELVEAARDAKHAFDTTSLWRVQQAIVWLGVSVGKAERYGLSGVASKGKKTLEDLKVLKRALLDLKHAKFQANVSVCTKSGVPESLDSLNTSIHTARHAGLTNGMPTAMGLLHKLQVLNDAVQAAADATAIGNEILAVGGNKGERSLASAATALNASLVQAAALGLSDNSTVSYARGAYDRIVYILGARHSLQKAMRGARRVLDRNGSVLSDDGEEAALDTLEPAIAWGTDVGLLNGLDASQAAGDHLLSVERAKENMTFALATGNASLKAKAGVAAAVGILEAAVSGSLVANTSAGVAAAQEQLEKLRAILGAYAALDEALIMAKRAMTSRSGYAEAGNMLNVSAHVAEDIGLDKEAAIAENQLRRLRAFARADRSLIRALHKSAPARRPPKRAIIEDLQPNVTFKRFGLKVVELPQVINGNDDGDNDFDEHIKALEDAIQRAKRRGEIDPQMEALYENALGMKSAHALLSDAIATGNAAMNSKSNVDASVAELTTALREARERELVLDTQKGSSLLVDLQKIPPALEKIRAAMLAVNVSMRTQTGMDNALAEIMSAIELNRQLNLLQYISEADHLCRSLLLLKQAYVQLKAAIMQGQISLKNEDGEEAAIAELEHSIGVAQDFGLKKLVEDAQELHDELKHMDEQHNNLQVAMNPSSIK